MIGGTPNPFGQVNTDLEDLTLLLQNPLHFFKKDLVM